MPGQRHGRTACAGVYDVEQVLLAALGHRRQITRRDWLKALAQERRRFGYRRLHVLLRREGHAINRKRVQRIYREERLTVRRRGGRKRAMGKQRPLDLPVAAQDSHSPLSASRRFAGK